jgi:hypothetical protein
MLSGVDTSTLRLEQGNAHSADDLVRCLLPPNNTTASPPKLPDAIIFSIGNMVSLNMSNFDREVCEKGMVALLTALNTVRTQNNATGRPRLVALSSTGISPLGRDLPLLMMPLYAALKVPHADKKKLEEKTVASGEEWTIVRPSLLTDGKESGSEKVRVGVEDPVGKKVEVVERGYTISREDVGKWIFEKVVEGGDRGRYVGKAVSLTT